MTTLYGISNCDTVKKAMKWLTNQNITFTFHDFRKDGLDESLLASFVEQSDWSTLINKRSTTFRNLPENLKSNLVDQQAVATVLEQPTLLKRPLLVANKQLTVGFSDKTYLQLFEKND